MKAEKGDVEVISFLVICIVLAVIALIAMATSNENSALSAAEAQGYSDISIKSVHRFFSADLHGCSDWKATVMKVTNPIGKKVEIIVCEGLIMKGATIRIK